MRPTASPTPPGTALFSTGLVVVKGPVAAKWFNRIAAPGLSVVIVVMLVELGVAGGLSWRPAAGRVASTPAPGGAASRNPAPR